ncbi:MAG: DUF1667 domain-containing protein [Clostridiales bacterium]|nr:DUF1667 domain-containing protein [Clostridiales bacterium]
MKREDVIITCIACPNGCDIKITFGDDGNIASMEGYKCKNGVTYATAEVTAPERILTSSVAVVGGAFRLASVKTQKPIPKALLIDAVKEIAKVKVKAPISVGDVLLEDLAGTGVQVVSTCNVQAEK